MKRIRVMHVTDTLHAAGAERVAVNLVNLLPRDQFETYLCTTREEGPLTAFVSQNVKRLHLARSWRFDWRAIRRLVEFIRAERIQILHAHSTALFVAKWAALYCPDVAVVWHDHFGLCMVQERPRWIYRWLTSRIGGVVAVNEQLADWSRHRLGVPAERVWYVPNFVCAPDASAAIPELPGTAGQRLICVAKFRPQKDHLTLLRAMHLVQREQTNAHLLLVGGADDPEYLRRVQEETARLDLGDQVTWLGERYDIGAVLRGCDIGVLSSESEGLPLALLEYGMAGLAVVATDVGQCSEVLAQGQAGVLVPTANPAELAQGMLALLRSSSRRATLGRRLQHHVNEAYSASAVLQQLTDIYECLVDRPGTASMAPVSVASGAC